MLILFYVAVSAENLFRDKVRSLAQCLTEQKVDYEELEFQPENSKGFWSRKKPQVDYEGVIREKDVEDFGVSKRDIT
jgi:hypothetical protein